MTTVLNHKNLGDIRGVLGDNVVKFLGVKYASLSDRFAKSEVVNYNAQNNITDATRLGPMVPSPLQGCLMEFGLIQHTLPVPDFSISELDGLHLNITIPLIEKKIPDPSRKLPVFVFVHGGGYSVGSNSWPQYSQARLVELSASLGLPVIGVGINYRLGLTGFLTSTELREAGYASNNGLRDQANAFRWVKKYIEGFGGDGDNVTYIGESAGSVSGMLHLHSDEPLFKRFISMSGSSLMLKPLPLPVTEFAYASVLKALDIENLSGPERVKFLLESPIEKLLESVSPSIPLMPVVDGELIPGVGTLLQISNKVDDPALPMPGRQWCKSLLTGDCQFDGSIGEAILGDRAAGIAQPFCTSIKKSLAHRPSAAQKVLSTYGITPDLSDDVALRLILTFATEISFYVPVLAFATGWPGDAYVYHFNEPNPWEGRWKGESTHVLDIAFLFQNYNEFLNPLQKEVAVKLASDFIRFISGNAPWAAFEMATREVMPYGPSTKPGSSIFSPHIKENTEQKSGRRSTIHQLGEDVPLDELLDAWGNFVSGQ